MPNIQEFINNRHKYKIDTNYQRPANAWSKEDNQCLIDTILRNEPMPIFFINYKADESTHYIVDGQQRLNAIKKFYDNKLKLNGKFSGEKNHGKTFNGDSPISDEQRENFLDYKLSFFLLEDYDDERVRLIFSRLQRGKPLQLGERLNAKPGSIVERMREIAHHPFMSKSIGVYRERYGVYPDSARIIFYEKFGAKQCGSTELYNFFDDFKDMSKDDRDYKNAVSTLNILLKCFPADPGNYQYLEKHAWVMAVYNMVRELSIGYSLQGKEDIIRKFAKDFHGKVYTEDFRNSYPNYQRFYDNVRGGWSEKIIALRRNILVQEFLKKYDLMQIDEKRQISDEDKIAVFAKRTSCEACSKQFKDYKEAEYHHKIRHADGGASKIENIMVLCGACHDRIHGKVPIELPSEEEVSESVE
ncbi:MAG: DUF262 domain-containing protein [Candidatus Omnitrophica bacterium]|nr:DUF262 domain-containing protein [Candidatus Omnitrophota bacterium]